jgi:MarR family transcriptional regulator, transcriptional regulator for hemolysin
MMPDETARDRFDQWAVAYDDFYPAGSRHDREFRLSRKLVLAARYWTALVDEAIRSHTGQSRLRWETLFAIRFSGRAVTTVELSERMSLQWPTLVRVLKDLEAEGLISRADNPTDGRSRLISLSEAGSRILDQVQPVLDPVRHAVLAEFSEEELAGAERILDRLLGGISKVSSSR